LKIAVQYMHGHRANEHCQFTTPEDIYDKLSYAFEEDAIPAFH